MKVIFDLPDGLTEADIPDLKAAITHWAKKRVRAFDDRPIDIKAARAAALDSDHKSLHAFVLSRGYPRSTAWMAMQGKCTGPRGRMIVEDIKREFGL